MITINLLPKGARKTEKKIVLPYKAFLILLVLILLFFHLTFFVLTVWKKIQIGHLSTTWRHIELESRDAATMREEIKKLEGELGNVGELLSRKVSLAQLFSSLNVAIPAGLWLDRFSFSEESLVIQGSVVSVTQNEMTIIGKFLQDIKNDPVFSSFLSKIELSSVQRRTIKAYDVVDFVLVGEIVDEQD